MYYLNKDLISRSLVCVIRASIVAILTIAFSLLVSQIVKRDNSPAEFHKEINSEEFSYVFESYTNLPLHFEFNKGQFNERVKFSSRGDGYNLFLLLNEIRLQLNNSMKNDIKSKNSKGLNSQLQMELVGANPNTTVSGIDKLPGVSNYYIGNDPSCWQTNIQQYKKVQYKNIYPGIDLVFYGNRKNFEFDFIISPGSDPNEIRLRFNGVNLLSLDNEKNLILSIENDTILCHRPLIYQNLNGDPEYLVGEYQLNGSDEISFRIAEYNPSLTLVIDPVVSYASYLGGSMSDEASGIALDEKKNIYITGDTYSADFPITGSKIGVAENTDIFITKISEDGQSIEYSTVIGGRYGDFASDIQVSSKGSAYVCGRSGSYDDSSTEGVNEGFPIVNGFQTDINDHYSTDALAIKLNSDGTLVYSTLFGAPDEDEATDLDIDADSCIYLIGTTLATIGYPKFPIRNAFQPERGGYDYDGFVTKIDPSKEGDASLIYSTFLGATGDDILNDIAVDKYGNAIIVGRVWGENFPLVNAMYSSKKGDYDAFITKLDANGDQAVFSTFIGGDENDIAFLVDVGDDASIYVDGSGSENFPTTQDALGGDTDFGRFFLKMSPNGQSLEYSTFLFLTYIQSFKVDEDGSIFLAISEFKYDPDAGKSVTVRSTCKLNSTATEIIDKSEIVGIDYSQLNNLENVFDDAGNLYLVSSSSATDLFTLNPIQETNHGWKDLYIVKTKPSDDIIVINSIGDSPDENPFELPCSTGETIIRDGKEEPERTLRAAIETANAMHLFKPVTIKFDIPDNPRPVIQVESELPTIEVPLILDGTTQPHSNSVEIDGNYLDISSEADGLNINTDNVIIRGLVIYSFPEYGINILSGSQHKMIKNKIGFDHTGTNLKVNGFGAIKIQGDARECIIGGDEEDADMNHIGGGVLLVGADVERISILKNVFGIPEEDDQLPIDLSLDLDGEEDGPTACNWIGPNTGPNNLIPPPRILSTSEKQVVGFTKPNSRIILYKVEDIGKDYKRYFARRAEPIGDWLSDFDGYFEMPVVLEPLTEIAATVTDINGNTSELSQLKRPLIFLPGVAGSWLKDQEGRNLWPPFESLASTDKEWNENLRRLSMDEKGKDVYGKVKPYRIIENFLGNDLAYGAFLENIEGFYPGHVDNKNPENLDLWRMPYDWRKSPYEIADSLKKLIDKLTDIEGDCAWSTEVDIAAHSMGGLVASAYVRKYPEHSKKHLHRLVTIGTPYLGTPQTAAGHTKGYLFGLDDNRVVITAFEPDWGSVLKMFRNFPSAYSLLPSQAYFKTWEYLHYLEDFRRKPLWSWNNTADFLCDPKQWGLGLGRNLSLFEQEQNVHDLIDDWREWQGPPQIFRLYGRYSSNTAVRWEYDRPFTRFEPLWADPIRKEKGDSPAIIEYRNYLVPILGRGDGTVTAESATLGKDRWNGGEGNYGTDYSGVDESKWIEDFELFLCTHMELVTPECSGVDYRLLEILVSGYRIVTDNGNLNKNSPDYYENEDDTDIIYVLGSAPISVTLKDENGNFNGPVSPDSLSKISYGLPEVGYWATEFVTTISAPQDKTYDLTIHAQNENTKVQVKRLVAHENNRDNILFNDQTLIQNGKMHFTLTIGGTDLNTNFEVDADGDGNYESNLAPAVNFISTSLAPAIPKPEPFILQVEVQKSDTANPIVEFDLPDVGGPVWQWELGELEDWIKADIISGSTPATISLELEKDLLNEGVYEDTLEVQLSIEEYVFNSEVILNFVLRDQPAVLTEIEINPSEVQLLPGQSQQFTAVGYDQLGVSFIFDPIWSATGGLIDSTGLYTADENMGFFTIQAENIDGTIVGTAQVEISNVLDAEKPREDIPKTFELYQNYPNPFNPVTTIKYSIPKKCNVVIKVFDMLGKEVTIISNDEVSPGIYSAEFNASNFSAGIYFYRIKAGEYVQTRKMVLLK